MRADYTQTHNTLHARHDIYDLLARGPDNSEQTHKTQHKHTHTRGVIRAHPHTHSMNRRVPRASFSSAPQQKCRQRFTHEGPAGMLRHSDGGGGARFRARSSVWNLACTRKSEVCVRARASSTSVPCVYVVAYVSLCVRVSAVLCWAMMGKEAAPYTRSSLVNITRGLPLDSRTARCDGQVVGRRVASL